MSQQDDFSSGFLLGTLVGGVVGGLLGALVASGKLNQLLPPSEEEPLLNGNAPDEKANKVKKRALKPQNGQQVDMESARRNLEDKIAQLNHAIDDVRQKLGGVNGAPGKSGDQPTIKEP